MIRVVMLQRRLLLLLLPLLSLFSCGQEGQTGTEAESEVPVFVASSLADSVALAHGFDRWAGIERLDFSFNVERNDTLKVARGWSWWPKSDSVLLREAEQETAFLRANTAQDSAWLKADQKFINDSYWVLMPFYLVWSKDGYESLTTYNDTMPISGAGATKLTVQYRNEGGYTPGDAYDLYLDQQKMIREWAYRPGGQEEAALVMSWEDYRVVNGLQLPGDHRSQQGVRIYHPELGAESGYEQ